MILEDFDYGLGVHDTQRYALGQELIDAQGNRWGYGRIAEVPGAAHRLMRGKKHSDFMSVGNGVVAAAQAVGTNRLTVANTTNRNFATSSAGNLIGALGLITAGSGIGQTFTITRRISDTAVAVLVTSSATGTWATALGTDSRFYLWFPGEVRAGDGSTDFIEGVLHYNAVAGDVGKFCFLQRSGVSLIQIDNSGTALGQGELMVPAAGGLVTGISVDATVNQANVNTALKLLGSSVGRALSDTTATTDVNVLAALDIPPAGISRALANMTNSFNDVTIGSN